MGTCVLLLVELAIHFMLLLRFKFVDDDDDDELFVVGGNLGTVLVAAEDNDEDVEFKEAFGSREMESLQSFVLIVEPSNNLDEVEVEAEEELEWLISSLFVMAVVVLGVVDVFLLIGSDCL